MAGLGRPGWPTNNREAHGVDDQVNVVVGQPFAHGHMGFDAAAKHRQYLQPFRFQRVNQVAQVFLFLHNMLAKGENGNERRGLRFEF